MRANHVVILIGRFPPGALGGAEHQAECWARRLAGGRRVTVVTREEPGSPAGTVERDGFRVVRVPLSRVPVWRAIADLAAIERAVARLEPRPDVLLCFQTFISGFAGVRIRRRLGIPAIVWIRGEGEYRMAGSFVNRHLGPRVWRDADRVLVQSEGNRVAFLQELGGLAPATRDAVAPKVLLIPNGLDLPGASVAAAPRGLRVLSVGRLIRDKGMDVAIEAAARAGVALTLAGVGPERERLEVLARARGVDVRFEGFADRTRLATLYSECAAFVLAARHGEGQPNVVLEAMAHARPIVASDVTGVRDLIRDGVNGLLVPPDDPAALVAALGRLSREPGLADRLGAAARQTAAEYAWDRVRPRLEAVLEECVR